MQGNFGRYAVAFLAVGSVVNITGFPTCVLIFCGCQNLPGDLPGYPFHESVRGVRLSAIKITYAEEYYLLVPGYTAGLAKQTVYRRPCHSHVWPVAAHLLFCHRR